MSCSLLKFLNQTPVWDINLDNTNIKEHLSEQLVDRSGRYGEIHSLSLRRNGIESLEEISQLLWRNIASLDISENNFLEMKLSNESQVQLQGLRTLTVDHNQAAGSLQISPEFFTTTDVNSLSLFGTEVFWFRNRGQVL